MANFVAIVDPNPERRSQFIKTVTPMLPPVEGLLTYLCELGDFIAVWAATPTAPISYETDVTGAAVLLGEAIAPYSAERMTAATIRDKWQGVDPSSFPSFDGFYMAIAYHPERGLTVGADILGLFPIYYYQQGEVLLVASSPELLQYHPCFHRQFNPSGLVGILLTNGLAEGQTLWSGVYRLGVGCLLIAEVGQSVREVTQYTIPRSLSYDKYTQATFAEQLDAVDHVLSQTIARHTSPDTTHILMLSGGLDSRLLAGYLHRQQIDTVALTFGRSSDLEMKCATPVARALGFPHHTRETDLNRYPELAQTSVKWSHLANGFNIVFDSSPETVQQLGSRIVTGFIFDVLMGKAPRYLLFAKGGSFEPFLRKEVNVSGIAPELLGTLLRQEVFGDALQETLDRLQQRYQGYSDLESRRALIFKLQHRQRFHVGSGAWQFSFNAWPTVPVLDRRLLETMTSLPDETLHGRKIQNRLICDRFPQLAQLPLDRNCHDTKPLQPTPLRQRLEPFFQLQRRYWGLQRRLGYDRRYYYRVLDSNNVAWRAIRRQAEPYRERVQHLLHRDVLDRLLPKPDVRLQFQRDAILESSATKTLLGFLLWSADHL
ncbi:hypothetical protein H6G89_26040 [Oscillatoria sp. FACHB-1407]|uniref:asparagine synthase-related protein n=1 Tax=Oscillatoria sp. FACHB-1407 TaxID=2692847 RepID=UPI001684CF53|nr:asparagine synthetase B family protein [Oscillatoria sp. FACHB-1407]MBD2464471.1 hypothetical protein [Oscillatoria sp. FACHB-1407]